MILSRRQAGLATAGLAAVFVCLWIAGFVCAGSLRFGGWGSVASAALGASLLALAYFDFHTMRLPDALTLPLILAGLSYVALTGDGGLLSSALGAFLGYAIVYGLAALYRAQRGVEGIGLGDGKLLAAGGAWCGVLALPVILLVGSGLGLLVVFAARGASDHEEATRIPFGPWLATGIWSAWCLNLPELFLAPPL